VYNSLMLRISELETAVATLRNLTSALSTAQASTTALQTALGTSLPAMVSNATSALSADMNGIKATISGYPSFAALTAHLAVDPYLKFAVTDGFNSRLTTLVLPDGTRTSPVRVVSDFADGNNTWLLLLAGPGADAGWCYGASGWTSADGISAGVIAGADIAAALSPPTPAKHPLFGSLAAFDAIRLRVVPADGSGLKLLDFTFGGVDTAQALMFTSHTYLASGPDWPTWHAAFGGDRSAMPTFERGGDCTNSSLPCQPRVGCGQPLMFGFNVADGSNHINSGLGTNRASCGGSASCGFAHGDWMTPAPQSVAVLGRLALSARVTFAPPLPSDP
jgi:hypothetical protein